MSWDTNYHDGCGDKKEVVRTSPANRDIVKVAQSHTGINLATTFTKILDDFGILNKVIYF
jgi:hypothetical protein